MNNKATIYYYDIGDYLSREEKLARIKAFGSIAAMRDKLTILKPNKHGDWINHRDEGFEELIPLDAEKKFLSNARSFFTTYSNGVKTQRDAWCYNSDKTTLADNINRTLDFYEEWRGKLFASEDAETRSLPPEAYNSKHISWTYAVKEDAERGREHTYNEESIQTALYRPFFKQHFYFNRTLNERPYRMFDFFPTPEHENLLICVSGGCILISDCLVDLHFNGDSQCFPLYWYDKNDQTDQMNLFDTSEEYTRRDGISDFILERARELCGSKVTKRNIFDYVYGILHSEEYRTKYAVNLKKSLPRLPLPEDPKVFWAYSKAGAELAELHLNYETLPPYADLKEDSPKANPSYRVQKMRFAKEGLARQSRSQASSKVLKCESAKVCRVDLLSPCTDVNKTAIIYNDEVTIWNIPLEAYEYVVNGKPALEWIMERYQITTHRESGIINDPNLWCDEHNQPRYIIDLLKRIVTLSLETMKIVKSLPELGL